MITIFVNEFPTLSETFIVHKVKALAESGESITVVALRHTKQTTHQDLLRGIEGIRLRYVADDTGPPLRRVIGWVRALALALSKSPKDTYALWRLTKKYGSLRMRWYRMRKLWGFVGLRSDVFHFEFGAIAARYVDLLENRTRPCIVSFRGSDILVYPHYNDAYQHLYREVMRYADRIHCTSEAVARKAAQFGDEQKIFVNYPSIDASFFDPRNAAERDPNLIVSIGRLEWVKGLTYALLAVAQLVPDFPSLRYVIVGEGASKNQLLFYAAELGIRDHVEFYGRATTDEVKGLLERASVFVLSSVSEGVSNAALEAMAMEVPVVTTDAGGMREAIDDGVEGFVVPRYDAGAIAAKVRVLLEDNELRKRMGQKARQRVLRDFTIERQVQVFLDEYYRLYNR